MPRRALNATVATIVAVALSLPAAPRADDDWGGQPGGGYDVSVDLNVQGGVGFETFHGPLQSYGDWVVVGSYGQVWRPRVAPGWRPYYYGRWEWTNEGWFWVSDEPWGWAAYHYGRWAFDPYYGWVWVPGYEWAPAWVSWRYSGDAVGWAPLAPGYSVYVTAFPFVDSWWTFVPCNRFVSVPVYSVAYAPHYARRWYDATTPAPAFAPRGSAGVRGPMTPAWGGPAPRVIEQRIGRPIAPARIVRAPSPGERARPGEIPVYRPERPQARDDRGPGRAGGPGREFRQEPGGNPGRGFTPSGGNRGGAPGFAPPAGGGSRGGAPGFAPPGGGGSRGGAPGFAPPAGGGSRGGAPGFAPPGGGGSRGGAPGFAPPGGGGSRGGGAVAPAPRGGNGGNAGGGHRGGGGERGRSERH